MRKPTVFLYILGQILPTFMIGIMIFIFILLMFQFLKLTEFILVYDVSLKHISQLIINLSFSFLPIILPMSLLFAVLLTYSRLSADSEMVAFRALGYTPRYLTLPSLFFSIIICIVSGQTLFNLGPIARSNFDSLLSAIGNQKIISGVSPGTFSENFFDLVVYTNEIDKKTNTLKDMFIFDSRNPKAPVAIVAKEGVVAANNDILTQSASLTLRSGDIFQMSKEGSTKVNFSTYALNINSPVNRNDDSADADTFTMQQVRRKLREPGLNEEFQRKLSSEFHRRWAIAISCLIFGVLGACLGSQTNRRSAASSGFVVSVICIVAYWVMYVIGTNLSVKGIAPAYIALWIPNLVFTLFTVYFWNRPQSA
ncbi:MAG: LptF/LptG family permease [Bdellovibrionales bacterium]|nr:LptF/LptG family permease [Bdellovibrionales bacterium]